ncbi:hypothetical protein BMI90_01210 [Thioclava sp. L04-15]|uniref:GGDEF domain-containing protein n=1 Tax=Thioclava sp. L04-15 TaxID=1915318 RepID=UPI0009978276|nr:GGDEF domain-containing protein [Thioclava sp. L04-15]OOY28925.1 hypothetical protein BMI90_01210 [Thioclava sp. L04-15]TNE83526.1 MAG: GGDEF domain-containing protein [Paracoccaceae bacterium]
MQQDRQGAFRIIALMMAMIILSGTVHNFLVSAKTGTPALHPFSALGYLSIAISLLVQAGRPLAPPYWLRAQQIFVLCFMGERMIEAFVPGWPKLITSDFVAGLNTRYNFHGRLSVETATGIFFLHLAMFLAPTSLGAAVLAYFSALCLGIFMIYQLGFGILLFDGQFSMASFGSLLFSLAGVSLLLRNNGYMRPFFSHRGHGTAMRALLFAAIAAPFIGGVVFIEVQHPEDRSVFALQLLFSSFSALFVGLLLILGRQINIDARQIERVTKHDPLTGALSRQGLRDMLPEADLFGGALLIDIDHLKAINDRFGHSQGDRVLVWLAETLHGLFTSATPVTRWSGGEFLILTTDADDNILERHATLIHRAVAAQAPLELGKTDFQVSVSIGYSVIDPSEENDIHAALGRADAALYTAKRMGRNQSCSAHSKNCIHRASIEDLVA